MLKMIRHWLQIPHAPGEDPFADVVVSAKTPLSFATTSTGSADAFAPLAVRRQFSAVMFGVGNWLDQPPNAYEQRVLSELQGLQASWHKHEQLLPRLPRILPELWRTLRDPHATLGSLVAIVKRDPMLVAAVTRTVRSTYFHSAGPAMQLRDAVLLIGQDGLRRLLPTVAMQPIFHISGGRFCMIAGPHVWAHAQRSALAGLALAGGETSVAAFDHYLAGLAMGASLIVVVRTLDAQQQRGVTLQSVHFADAMLRESRGLAVRIAAQWDLPDGTKTTLQKMAASPQGGEPRSISEQAEYMAMMRGLAHGGYLDDDVSAMQAHLAGAVSARVQRCYSELLRFDEADAQA